MRHRFPFPRLAGVDPYIVAGVCLLVAAAALRFWDLPGDGLSYDEGRAANNSRGAFSEILRNTRYENSSPMLYPLALWAIQKADSSAFSVRAPSAAASVATVAVLLFLLPRVGLSRRAAFLAALFAAASIAAIENAKDAREYSIDALAAAMTVFGFLRYLKNGGKKTLSAALFIGPLLQYGLVLFGAATLLTAFFTPPPRGIACAARRLGLA